MFGKKIHGEVPQIETELATLTAETDAYRARMGAIDIAWDALQQRWHTATGVERVAIKAEQADLVREYKTLEKKLDYAHQQIMPLESKLAMKRSVLQSARDTLNTLENPPPWGLGDYTNDQITHIKRSAQALIIRLGGKE